VSQSQPPSGGGQPVAVYFAALLLGAAFWGGTWPVAKLLAQTFPPAGLGFWRWATGFAVMLPFGLPGLIRHRRAILRELPRLFFLAFVGIALFNYMLFRGVQTTTAVNGALLNGATPIYVLLLGLIGVGDRGTLRQIMAVAVALPGFILVVTHGEIDRLLGLEFVVGDLLISIGLLGWAVYTIYVRRWPSGLPPLAFMCVLAFLGAAILLPVWLWEISQGAVMIVSTDTVLGLVFLGVFASFGSYVVWNFGLGGIGPARAALFQYLIPLFAAVFAVFLVGESIHWYHLVGAALMFGGIYASGDARWGRRKPDPVTEPKAPQ
jgi:drug/metabolite transporter (DMT)-like permease